MSGLCLVSAKCLRSFTPDCWTSLVPCPRRMAGLSHLTNGVGKSVKHQTEDLPGLNSDQTRNEILQLSGFSNRLERVLLALLHEHSILKERVEKEISDDVAKLFKGLENEKSDRENLN